MANPSGGAIVARMLQQEGVETFFGIIDGTYTHLFAHCVELGMEMITPRHEAVAAHMAGAYARLTGKLGVCIASNGPGVANMLSGVAVENGEGNRVLLITSCRRVGIVYPDRGGAYQAFDQVKVISGMSKWSAAVPSADRLPELMRKALRACFTGRPGVVHLDVPESIVNGPCPEAPVLSPHQYRRVTPIEPPRAQLERAAELLASARLPMIHVGSGVIHAGAFSELVRVAEALHAPVTTSWSARSAFSESHPLAWPMLHIEACTHLRNEADLVLCIGSEVGETDWWGKAPYWAPTQRQRWIQVDVDDAALGRNRPVELAILGDARVFLDGLAEALRGRVDAKRLEARRTAVSALTRDKEENQKNLDLALLDRGVPLHSAHVGRACRRVFDDDTVFVFDGGNSAIWGHSYVALPVPNTQLSTGHFGHLGAGVGQALGAAIAQRGRPVCCVIGDGAMGFQMQEIETAVRYGLPVIFVICCDRQWGMVKINQFVALQPVKDSFKHALGPNHDRTINTELGEIEWDAVARAMGAHGERVSKPDELEPALRRAQGTERCAVIHVDVNPSAHLLAPGLRFFKDMHAEPAGE